MLLCRLSLLLLSFSLIVPASADTIIWFRLQGSNTVGARLAPAWAKAYLERQGIDQVTIQPAAVENELIVSGTQSTETKGGANTVAITIAAHGSATGFQALLDKQ